MTHHKSHKKGTALLMSMIILAILSAWAVSIYSMSGVNVQLAKNQQKANSARACAESGLDILRFWLGRVYMPGDTPASDRFSCLASFLQTDLAANSISNIPIALDVNNIAIGGGGSPVVLYSSGGQYFSAEIQTTNNVDILQMDITGSSRAVKRIIRVNYNFGTRAHTVFDYGVATKGALELHGNIAMSGANIELDAGVYIECPNDVNNALSIIGNSQVAGDVHITNPDATIDLQGGQAAIGGETAPEAYDHVFTGIPPTEFPVPDPTYFEHYVTNLYDPNNVLTEYENVRIPAETDPIIFSNVTFRGIVFIETPNIVTFSGNTEITGIIVGNGDIDDNSGTNQIIFLGTVTSHPVTDLPEEFGGLKDETGTFLMAPGFNASFGGNFDTLNGAIAANGIQFWGDAGGTIDGSVINYSDEPMELSGNNNLFFNRSGTTEMPAGFGPEIILYYVSDSYNEVVLGL
jgi:hypothetical protein